MTLNRCIVNALTLALVSGPALAQGGKPSTMAPAPAASSKPATTGTATAPIVSKLNLNAATAAELDKLPRMTPTHAKAIMEARAKAKFKSWDDFVARKILPSGAADAIRDLVTF